MQHFCEALHCGKIWHRCLEYLLTRCVLKHNLHSACVAHSIWEPDSKLKPKEEFSSNCFLSCLHYIWLMYIISAWPLNDVKNSWWELICNSLSNFTQMIWVNVILEFRIQMRSDLLRKVCLFFSQCWYGAYGFFALPCCLACCSSCSWRMYLYSLC